MVQLFLERLREEPIPLSPNHPLKIKIASFGCGLCQDYFALLSILAPNNINFTYQGYDITDWDSIQLLTPFTDQKNFPKIIHNNYLNDCFDSDIIIFQKSLSDIHNTNSLTALAQSIAKNSPANKRLFFLISYVRNSSCPQGETGYRDEYGHWHGYFDEIDKALQNSGFNCTQLDPDEYCYTGHQEKISAKYSEFRYLDRNIRTDDFTDRNVTAYQNYFHYELREYIR
ncbi:MAG: hypothetical protein IJ934_05745 [Acetobacter sp.]|nr:hypothetical protein [Acetobacter sp.]